MREREAYTFIFFFGPGLPLGLGISSAAACDAVRLMAGFEAVSVVDFFSFFTDPSIAGAAELDGDEAVSSGFSYGNFLSIPVASFRVTSKLDVLDAFDDPFEPPAVEFVEGMVMI
jgi:hypothetical protein